MLNLGIRFLVELLAVGFVGAWAYSLPEAPILRVALALAAAAIFILVWGAFLAPNAASGLTPMQKTGLGTVLLLVAAMALASAGQPIGALIFAVAVVANATYLLVAGGDALASITHAGLRG